MWNASQFLVFIVEQKMLHCLINLENLDESKIKRGSNQRIVLCLITTPHISMKSTNWKIILTFVMIISPGPSNPMQ